MVLELDPVRYGYRVGMPVQLQIATCSEPLGYVLHLRCPSRSRSHDGQIGNLAAMRMSDIQPCRKSQSYMDAGGKRAWNVVGETTIPPHTTTTHKIDAEFDLDR